MGASRWALTLSDVDHRPLGGQQAPTPTLQRLRNVEALYLAVNASTAGLPQGWLMGVQDREDGSSECRSVMDRIRVFNVTQLVESAHLRLVLDREITWRTDLRQERK